MTDANHFKDLCQETSTISYNCSPADMKTIEALTVRYYEIAKAHGKFIDVHTTQMDIATCHCNGCPLKLWQLFLAGPVAFVSDISGIVRHINRRTGRLEGGFWPLFAVGVKP